MIIRVGQGFWVYGIQGLFKSGIRYIAAEIRVFGISLDLNFRYKVYLGIILGIFGCILGYFGEFFSGILVYHYRSWPTLDYLKGKPQQQ